MNNYLINSENEPIGNKGLKDYLLIIQDNLLTFCIISILILVVVIFYASRLPDIYISSTSIKLSRNERNILTPNSLGELNEFGNDRFINNEIEILKSYNLRERVALTFWDSLISIKNRREYGLDYPSAYDVNTGNKNNIRTMINIIASNVNIEQKKGLDIIVISAESKSPYEAALVANIYAEIYKNFNLEINRNQLTYIRKFLDEQRNDKMHLVKQVEDTLRSFQEKGGIISLDEQSKKLIERLSDFESRLNATKIELIASNEVLKKYKNELLKQDPKMADYLESVTSETYVTALQKQISELQLNKDLALAKVESGIDISQQLKTYDAKIKDLKDKLDEKIQIMKSGIFASSPEEVRRLSQKIIEEEVRNEFLTSSVSSLGTVVRNYEEKFNRLPKTTIEFAQFQRSRESSIKLYTLIEEKYQEALINEESQPGNVLIIDNARIPSSPSKPNRSLIIVAGIIFSLGIAMGFVLIKNYFDTTIKTPSDIEKKNVYVLAWIPKVEELNGKSNNGSDFIIERFPSSIASESIRALRTRVQFSKMNKKTLKTILVSSAAPQEGKTTIALNLAGSFAHSNRRTLLIDADLRKPRLHQVFNIDKEPGMVNYLFGELPFDKILTPTKTRNLFLITSGTIAANPSEILESPEMEELFAKVKNEFDYVIVDSPPIVAVTDAEILARKVDGSILVVSANKTESGLLERGLQLIKNDDSFFLGTVLNNFSVKPGYGGYYKYYYYYTPEGDKKFRKSKKHSKESASKK